MFVEESPTFLLLYLLLGLSLLLVFTEHELFRYALGVVSAYTSLTLSIERAAVAARTQGKVEAERVLSVAGEPVKLEVTLQSWVALLGRVSRVRLLSDEGIEVRNFSTARTSGGIIVKALVEARVGKHSVDGVEVYLKVMPLFLSIAIIVEGGLVLRAVPAVEWVPEYVVSGTPYDIGLSRVGRTGVGTQFHSTREFKPGDEAKYIDWKASSRIGRLIVKLFEREVYRRVVLIVIITGRYFTGGSRALDILSSELVRLVSELVRGGAEVVVAVVLPGARRELQTFTIVRTIGDLAKLAEYFSEVSWDKNLSEYSIEYRTALWFSVKLVSEFSPGRSLVVYLGEPISDVDAVAGRIVVEIMRRLGHKPVFAIVSPEVLKIAYGEASPEDIAAIARIPRFVISEISSFAKVLNFYGEDLLKFLLKAVAAENPPL